MAGGRAWVKLKAALGSRAEFGDPTAAAAAGWVGCLAA